jgi:hypothetical protein
MAHREVDGKKFQARPRLPVKLVFNAAFRLGELSKVVMVARTDPAERRPCRSGRIGPDRLSASWSV